MQGAKQTLALVASAIVATTGWAGQGNGLVASADEMLWSRWQGRLAVGATAPSWQSSLGGQVSHGLKVRSLSLLGDYYFSRSLFGLVDSGGFRTTSGLLHGPRTPTTLGTANGFSPGRPFSIERRTVPGHEAIGGEMPADSATLPYLGVGYSGASYKSGWSFNADLGLVALYPGHVVKFGRVAQGTQALDEVLRDMRLAPVVQFGVSYSF